MSIKPIPEGYHTVTPYLTVRQAHAAIAFYCEAFGAKEVMRLTMPDGSIAHAEVRIGDSHVMLSEERPEWGNTGPQSLNGTTVGLSVYVSDCDAAVQKAVAAGAKLERPVADQFYGDRTGTILDPFGHRWTIATHKEDMTPAEMQDRMNAWLASMHGSG